MAEHPLYRLHVRPGRDARLAAVCRSPRGVSPSSPAAVPQGRVVPTEIEVAEDAAAAAGEHQLAGRLPTDVRGKVAREKRRHRTIAAGATSARPRSGVRVPRRPPPRSQAVDEAHDPADAKRGQLAPPQTAVSQREHDEPVLTDSVGQRVDLLSCQEQRSDFDGFGSRTPAAGLRRSGGPARPCRDQREGPGHVRTGRAPNRDRRSTQQRRSRDRDSPTAPQRARSAWTTRPRIEHASTV